MQAQQDQYEVDAHIEAQLPQWRVAMQRVLQRRRVPADVVEDLVQEALIVAWREREQLRDPSRALAWVRSIVLNRMRSHYGRVRDTEQLEMEPVCVRETPCDAAMRHEARERTWRLLGVLPRQEFLMLWLRHGHDVPPREIARTLSVDNNALRHLLHRTRVALQEGPRSRALKVALAASGIAS
ncbi:MAG: sigma-70 family RNA polymerase sigma factor [Planctomycetes bacterium]|nr:sigma-70 family RNA polymerase sigma factor [Planctomycetota bacterium]